jgi:hypothetical protein
LARVITLIEHLEYKKVKGKRTDSTDVVEAHQAERGAVTALLKCGNEDGRVTPRLIESLSSLVYADGVTSPWLSPQRPPLGVVLTILRRLRRSLNQPPRPGRHGAAARKREAKQARNEESFGDDEEP